MLAENNTSQLSNQANNLDSGESLSKSFLHSSLDTENDVISETIDPTKKKTEVNSMLTKQLCDYSMDLFSLPLLNIFLGIGLDLSYALNSISNYESYQIPEYRVLIFPFAFQRNTERLSPDLNDQNTKEMWIN
jgi:hypothetical protein